MPDALVHHQSDVCVLDRDASTRAALRTVMEDGADGPALVFCLMTHRVFLEWCEHFDHLEWMGDPSTDSLAHVPSAISAFLADRPTRGRVILLHDVSWAWDAGCRDADFVTCAGQMRATFATHERLQTFTIYAPEVFPVASRWRLMRCHEAVLTDEGICHNFYFKSRPEAPPPHRDVAEDLAAALTQLRLQGCLQSELMGSIASSRSIAARWERDLVALKRITEKVDEGRGLEEVLDSALDLVLELLDMGAGTVFLCDDRGVLTPCAERSCLPLTLDAMRDFTRRRPLADDTTHVLRWTGDCGDDDGSPIRSTLSAPLHYKGRCNGVLELMSAKPRSFSLEDLQLTQTLAQQLALAVENDRLRRECVRSERRWEDTFNSMPDLLIVRDREFRVLQVNRAVTDLLARPTSAILGRKCHQVLYDRSTPCDGCSAVLGAQTAPVTQVMGDETFVTRVSPLLDEHGQTRGAVHHGRNVTTERELVGRLVDAERMATLGGLISGVAHEINNPMTTVLGFAEMLALRDDLSDSVRDSIDCIRNEAQRASQVVRNLLGFARRHNAGARTPLDLNEVLRTCARVRANDLRLHAIALELDLTPDLPAIVGDVSALQQVFMNLLANASYAVSHHRTVGGRIEISSEQRDDEVRIHIVDNGPGIPVEVLPQLFSSFITTKPEGEGTGLGLSICNAIVRDHGGGINVMNHPQGGAMFSMRFPVPLRPPREAPAAPTATARNGMRYRILVIDDEPLVRVVLQQMLGLMGHQVTVATTATEGLQLCVAGNFDLVVSDVHMPDMSGPRLRDAAAAGGIEVPFIFVTGDTSSIRDDSEDYLLKPFRPPTLQAAVEGCMQRWETKSA